MPEQPGDKGDQTSTAAALVPQSRRHALSRRRTRTLHWTCTVTKATIFASTGLADLAVITWLARIREGGRGEADSAGLGMLVWCRGLDRCA